MARMHAKEKTTSGDSSRVVSMQLNSEALCIASMHVVLLDRELHYYEKKNISGGNHNFYENLYKLRQKNYLNSPKKSHM